MFRRKLKLKVEEKQNVIVKETTNPETNSNIILDRTGRVPIEFDGMQIAKITSDPNGHKNRWTEFKVFKTKYGKYVVQILGMTTIKGEFERSTVKDVNDLDDIPNILGLGDLAKAIYKQLSIVIGSDKL